MILTALRRNGFVYFLIMAHNSAVGVMQRNNYSGNDYAFLSHHIFVNQSPFDRHCKPTDLRLRLSVVTLNSVVNGTMGDFTFWISLLLRPNSD